MTIEAAPFAKNVVTTQIIYRDQWLEDKVLQIEKDLLGVQNKFGSVKLLVERLERGLDQVLEKMPEGAESRLALLEEKNLLLEYKNTLQSISVKHQASIEASNWLNTHRKFLVDYAKSNLFQRSGTSKMFDGLRVSRETIQTFCNDLDFYLLWIAHHLRMGTTPKEVPRGTIALVLPSQFYVKAFNLISNDKISMDVDLSEKAFKILKKYVNRFLIKRSLEMDNSTKT